jgi:hypothetical protein
MLRLQRYSAPGFHHLITGWRNGHAPKLIKTAAMNFKKLAAIHLLAQNQATAVCQLTTATAFITDAQRLPDVPIASKY